MDGACAVEGALESDDTGLGGVPTADGARECKGLTTLGGREGRGDAEGARECVFLDFGLKDGSVVSNSGTARGTRWPCL